MVCGRTVTSMPSFADVARVAEGLPEVVVGQRHGHRTWFVGKKAFAWERPFSKADIRRFGDQTPPDGEILAITTADLGEKESILATNQTGIFTIPHFNGYPAILVQLNTVDAEALHEAIVDGWLACAPPALAKDYLGS